MLTFKHFEVVHIECPRAESQTARDWLQQNGFSIQRSGPKLIAPAQADMGIFECEGIRRKQEDQDA